MKLLAKLVFGALACLGSMSAHAIAYKVTNLGAASTTTFSIGYDINNAGQIVGTIDGSSGYSEAAIWSNGAWQSLTPGVRSIGLGLNDFGHAVGATVVNGANVATLWKDGSAQLLPGFAGEPSAAYAINNAGGIVGTSTRSAFFGGPLPVQWNNGKVNYLPGVGVGYGNAVAINEAGQVAGNARVDAFGVAARWDAGKLTLPAGWDSPSNAYGINNQGTVVGDSVSGGDRVATIWSKDGVTQLTGTFSELRDINDAGVAVGNALFPDAGNINRAMLYLNGTAYNLNDLIVGERDGLGELVRAFAINDSGAIVGLAALDGQFPGNPTHAFLLTPVPEPEHWAMLLVGLGLVSVAARRKA